MKKRIFTLMLAMVMSAFLTVSAFAEYVYVTKSGKKYHKEGSRFIKNKETEKLTIEEAEEKGYEPSSEFLKEQEETKSKEK